MKKNHSCYWRRYLKHIALTLLFYPLSALGAQGHISIKGQSITIMQAIQLIEKNSDYTFFYNAADLENKQRKDINCNGSIDEILNEVFKDSGISYIVKNKEVILNVQKTNSTQQKKKRIVTGTILDAVDDSPIIGANITIKGDKNTGTISDIDGNFSLAIPDNKTILVVTYIGYKTREVPVEDLGNIKIVLEGDDHTLNEVVVVGSGTQKKVSVTGAITSIKGASLKLPSSTLSNSFAGKLAGVIAKTNSGEPGSGAEFYIRGIGTFGGRATPLILLDEIDKVSTDYKGDTFSALLEVLDSEQNSRFRDHYLEVPLDLSEVMFITTANSLQTIPRPLLDRMEIIEISSYTENEKLHIAQEHLVPKQLEKTGLTEQQLSFSKKAIWKMAHNYTKEAGVRQLERKIGAVCRKAAKELLMTEKEKIAVTDRNLSRFLGKEKYTYQMANAAPEVGIVRGLAWTSVGGDTLQIEVNVMPGKGEIMLTGKLGDVMKESARTGISYIRSVSKKYAIQEDFFEKHDIHVHIPEGAVPKDGPSAGITMATAILSAVTGKKVRADLAMTGEITLRGRVLPIGGLKEKLLAAKNAGIHTVLVPKENLADVEELSVEITKGLEIIPVESMNEVLKTALVR